jgi:hypothetical protein
LTTIIKETNKRHGIEVGVNDTMNQTGISATHMCFTNPTTKGQWVLAKIFFSDSDKLFDQFFDLVNGTREQ